MKKNTKIIRKRIKVKRSGKVLRKKSYQSHYNSNESGKERRGKRKMVSFGKKTGKKLAKLVS